MTLSDIDQSRLSKIRMQNMIASAEMNTEHWESTFFIRIIDESEEELRRLRKTLEQIANHRGEYSSQAWAKKALNK